MVWEPSRAAVWVVGRRGGIAAQKLLMVCGCMGPPPIPPPRPRLAGAEVWRAALHTIECGPLWIAPPP